MCPLVIFSKLFPAPPLSPSHNTLYTLEPSSHGWASSGGAVLYLNLHHHNVSVREAVTHDVKSARYSRTSGPPWVNYLTAQGLSVLSWKTLSGMAWGFDQVTRIVGPVAMVCICGALCVWYCSKHFAPSQAQGHIQDHTANKQQTKNQTHVVWLCVCALQNSTKLLLVSLQSMVAMTGNRVLNSYCVCVFVWTVSSLRTVLTSLTNASISGWLWGLNDATQKVLRQMSGSYKYDTLTGFIIPYKTWCDHLSFQNLRQSQSSQPTVGSQPNSPAILFHVGFSYF